MLHRIAAFDGIVRDRAAKPVKGATVFQSGDGPMRTRTTTDSEGRFRLPGVIAGKAILFVRKDGFRFHGQPVDTQAGPVDLVLTRVEEVPLSVLKTRSGAVPHAEEMSVARRLLAPYLEKVVAKGTDGQKVQALRVAAEVDPAHALELLDTQSQGKPQVAVDMLRSLVAVAFAAQSPDDAESIAESIKDAGSISWCLTDLAGRLPASAHDRKAKLLGEAQLHARSVKQPGERIRLIARVAERWLDLGARERATALLNEGRSLAKEVPSPAYELAMFAESLARIDLPAALELVEKSKTLARRGDRTNRVFIYDRAYGEIAYRIASTDPAGAERLLGLIVAPFRRDGYVVAACAKMAALDQPRARRLAESIDDPVIRPMPWARWRERWRPRTSRLRLPCSSKRWLGWKNTGMTGGRLPQHRIAWRRPCFASSRRLPRSACRNRSGARLRYGPPLLDERGEGSMGRSDAELAMNIARYDQNAAAAVLARALEGFHKADVDSIREGFVAMAMALIDPARVVSLVESLSEDSGLDRNLPKNSARLFAAELLAKEGEARWLFTRGWAVSMWTPEGSDL